MIDAAFSVHPTPLGEALIVVTDAGLASLHVLHGAADAALTDLAHQHGVLAVADAGATASVTAELDAYFDGDLRAFETPIDWRLVDGFSRAALQAVYAIPYGETASYGEIAVTAGAPRAHRAVGSACARTPWSIVVPAHRVVRSDGSLGEYGGYPEHKRFLLELEGALPSVRV